MFTDVSDVLAAYIITALMMVAASTSQTSVNLYQTTRRSNVKHSHYHTACPKINHITAVVLNLLLLAVRLGYSVILLHIKTEIEN
jgi:hypothetical protein